MKFNKIFAIIMVVFVVLGGSVFAVSKVTNTNPLDYISSITVSDTGNENINEADESAQLSSLAKITPQQAQEYALVEVPGVVQNVELENENGNVVYGVEILSAGMTADVKVDAGNGNILKVESDNEEDNANENNDESDANLVQYATITQIQAENIAKATYAGNGVMNDVELEDEDGTIVYAVEFKESDGNEVDIKIDAKTGSVVKIEDDRYETGEEDSED